jgi:hypothetical protein
MSFGKGKGDKGQKSRMRNFDDQLIDASPGGGDAPDLSPTAPPKVTNVRQTKAWLDTTGGAKRLWTVYKNTLVTAFQRMNRTEQIALIDKGSVIVTIGVVVVVLATFYQMLPSLLRIFLAPGMIAGAWFFAKRVVTPVMIARFEHYLNPDVGDDR